MTRGLLGQPAMFWHAPNGRSSAVNPPLSPLLPGGPACPVIPDPIVIDSREKIRAEHHGSTATVVAELIGSGGPVAGPDAAVRWVAVTAPTIEQAALDYLSRGWSVIPVRERAKRPAVAWKTYQSRLVSEATLHDWFRRSPDYNVAIVTGALSGLVVVDVDPRHGGDKSLRELEREHGPLPKTMESITGGGGRHLYFCHPGGVVSNRTNIEPGIDLRGDGGCIVAPPSVHPSGKRYRWKRGHGPGQVAIARLPEWLH